MNDPRVDILLMKMIVTKPYIYTLRVFTKFLVWYYRIKNICIYVKYNMNET